LQKGPIILRSILIVGTPYQNLEDTKGIYGSHFGGCRGCGVLSENEGHLMQPVPEKMRLKMVIRIQNEILDGPSSCLFSNETFEKKGVQQSYSPFPRR